MYCMDIGCTNMDFFECNILGSSLFEPISVANQFNSWTCVKFMILNFYPLSKFGGLMCGLFGFSCGKVVD